MNILLVYHELGGRGGEKLFLNLANGLIVKGHKVNLCIGRITNNTPPHKKLILIKPSKIINHIFQNNWIFIILSMPFTFFNILKNLSDIDVIYTGESFTAFYPSLFASLITGKKLVLSAFEIKNCFLINKVKHAATINKTLVPVLKKAGIKNVTYIPAGIDFPKFKSKKPNKNMILMVGTIHPAKRQDIAIEAFELAKKKIPDLKLVIAGGGDTNNLKFQILNLKLQNSVKITGFISENQIKEYYQKSSLCLMCGPIGGLTILESLYFNKNIIYPTSGNPPLGPVEEHNLGTILPKNDPKLYAEKIVDIIKHPKKYEEKLKRDRKFVLKNFSVEKFTSKTLKILAPAKV